MLKDQFDNQFSGHVNVTVNPLPLIELMPDNSNQIGQDTISVCVRDSVWLDAGFDDDPAGTIYYWDNNYEGRYYRAATNGNWLDWQTHTVEVRDGATECTNTGSITIFFDFNQCAIGVPETKVNLDEALIIQPNPNQGAFTLMVKEYLSDIKLTIIDIGGREVYTGYYEGTFNPGHTFNIQPEDIEKGLYFVRLSSGTKSIVKKMIVQ